MNLPAQVQALPAQVQALRYEELRLTSMFSKDMDPLTRQCLGEHRKDIRRKIIELRTRLRALGIKVYAP